MYALVVQNGRHRGQRIAIRAAVLTVGSGEDCDVRLAGEGVAPRHARLQEYGGIVTVSALQAGAAVKVNGVAEIARRLEPGDRLAIGEFELEFQSRAEDAAPRDAARLRRPAPVLAYVFIALFLVAQLAAVVALDRFYRATVHEPVPPAAALPAAAAPAAPAAPGAPAAPAVPLPAASPAAP